jgi:hypothetical protein
LSFGFLDLLSKIVGFVVVVVVHHPHTIHHCHSPNHFVVLVSFILLFFPAAVCVDEFFDLRCSCCCLRCSSYYYS